MTTTTATRTYACGVCRRKITAEKSVYSRHTGSRYCIDIAACMKRAKRGAKA